MGFRIISTVISVLLFIQFSEATADGILSGDAVDQNSSHFFTIEEELGNTSQIDDVNLRAERAVSVIGTVISVIQAGFELVNQIFSILPESVTRTCIVTIRNFLDTKALVGPVVYTKASKMKAIPPKRIGPRKATILEFDQEKKDGKPEGSLVYNIEGTDLYVTILFHVEPPNTYNARIFQFETDYRDIYVNLHNGMKTVAGLYPLVSDDIIQYDIRKECGYKVSVVMTDHELAAMQVDVYDCPDIVDTFDPVVTNQTINETNVDTLGCKASDLPRCGCCIPFSIDKANSLSSANSLFFFPVISTYVFFSTFLAMFYGIPRNIGLQLENTRLF